MKKNKTTLIIHADGDSFFSSCEISLNPFLKGKPVVTGKERGIASAMSPEAKEAGVTRGMPIYMVRRICPQAVIVSSGYHIYGLYSRRVFSIINRYAQNIEKYSVDECFIDVTEDCNGDIEKAEELARKMRDAIRSELALTFSFGVSTTKVLAKVGSKLEKPNGLVVINTDNRRSILEGTQIEKVWGIGRETSVLCRKHGLINALLFADLPLDQLSRILSKPYQEIWHELNGVSVFDASSHNEPPKSIMRTGTFSPASSDPIFLLSQLALHVEDACFALRRHNLSTKSFSFFIKSKDFRYYRTECTLSDRVSTPQEILKAIQTKFKDIYSRDILYRASGVAFHGLREADIFTFDMFGGHEKRNKWDEVYKVLDKLEEKYAKRNPLSKVYGVVGLPTP